MGVKVRKITVHLPEELVAQALEASGESLTETIRLGLRAVAARGVFKEILSWRGKYKFGIDIKKLREEK